MRVLNLYAGIGGNRKLWEGHEVTAVEWNGDIAVVYGSYFESDEVIIGDAHDYLLKNYQRFDFIWSSPPCPTHSRMAKATRHPERRYPDMKLWQEIIFLQHFFKGKWVVENVIPYYDPFIQPSAELQRHYFWSNFRIPGRIDLDNVDGFIQTEDIKLFEKYLGFEVNWKIKLKGRDRTAQVLRNCVHPEIGLHILNCALEIEPKQIGLFA